MQKFIVIIALIISIFCVKVSPYNLLDVNMQEHFAISHLEKVLSVNKYNEPKFPQIVTIGAVTGEVLAGFTLAEVLITLLMIGVVSSLVIPGLIQDSQEAEFHSAWKKTYSDLNQALMLMAQDNAGSIKGACSNGTCLRNLFSEYIKNIKLCDVGKSNGNCWLSNSKYLNGTPHTDSDSEPGMVLSNGTLLRIWLISSACDSPVRKDVSSPIIFNQCGILTIDINGFKEPNTWGKDIYGVHLLENQIKPMGVQGDANDSDCRHSGQTGLGCGAKYLYQ